jgi:diadenosine tetraphosphate (Ap4A) HIT family hydrolase
VASIFTKIINGELPGNFVWKDDDCVAFLTIAPMRPGHTLVVPRLEIDHWLDVDPPLLAHLSDVSQCVGKGIAKAFNPTRVGTIVLGLEVSHFHIHVVPVWNPTDLDFHNADANAKPVDLALAADQLRNALRELGYKAVSA